MDEDLRKYLDAKFEGVRSHIGLIEARSRWGNLTDAGERDALALLEKRIRTLEDRVAGRAPDAGELNAMARFSDFAETSEERWVALVTRVEAVEKKLEAGEMSDIPDPRTYRLRHETRICPASGARTTPVLCR